MVFYLFTKDKISSLIILFYKHKYDLLDSFITEKFMTIVSSRLCSDAVLTEETLCDLILIMCDYHNTVGSCYSKLYKSASVLIDVKVQAKLQNIIEKMINNTIHFSKNQTDKSELITVMISSGIYCTTKRWHSKGKLKDASSSSALAKDVLSFMLSGLSSLK